MGEGVGEGVPITGVLGEKVAEPSPGPRVSLPHPKGGRGRAGVTEMGQRTGGGRALPPRRGTPLRPGRGAGAASAGARPRGCRREAGAAGGARQARKAVLGAVSVWPAAGGGPG